MGGIVFQNVPIVLMLNAIGYQQLQRRQGVGFETEVKYDFVGFLAFTFCQILTAEIFVEIHQQQAIWLEASNVAHNDGVHFSGGVALGHGLPKRIGALAYFRPKMYGAIEESNAFAFLIEHVIAVLVAQGKDVIGNMFHAAQHKMTFFVGFGDA